VALTGVDTNAELMERSNRWGAAGAAAARTRCVRLWTASCMILVAGVVRVSGSGPPNPQL
jgi:hypothetical protein